LAENFRSELDLEWQGRLNDLVTDLAWSPSDNSWAASSAAGEVVWNAGLGDLVGLKSADDRSIGRLAFSGDGRWLAAGGQAGQLFIWERSPHQDRETSFAPSTYANQPPAPMAIDSPPQLVKIIEIDRWIEHLAWHPIEPLLAISYGAQIKIWDVRTTIEMVTWQFDKSSIFDLQWHPNGSSLAVAGYKGVQIWSPEDTHAPVRTLKVDTATTNIAWTQDGRYLAAANLDRTLTIVDWQHPDDPWILQGFLGKIRHLSWLRGSTLPCLVVASGTDITRWELNVNTSDWSGRLLEGHQSTIEALTVHSQSPIAISGDTDGYTCLWSGTGEIEQILTNIVSGITILKGDPHGTFLAIGSHSGSIEVWSISINTDEEVTEIC
jgi:WD40 repeat protein